MSMYLFATSISAAIQEGVTPALADPHLIWAFAGTAIPGVVFAAIFYVLYRHLDNDEFLTEGVAEAGNSVTHLTGPESVGGSEGHASEQRRIEEKV